MPRPRNVVSIALKRPLSRVLAAGHPWIYRDALAEAPPPAGQEVRVVDERGRFVARGLSDAGPIGVRVFTRRDEPVGSDLFQRRVAAAFALRVRALPERTDAFRCLHGEGDRLPGVVCDRYAEWAVLKLDGQALSARLEPLLDVLWPALQAQGVRGLLLRETARKAQPPRRVRGVEPPEEVCVREHGMRLLANLWRGQKTGLFLDHRESRRRIRQLATGARVLNLYGYTGGFSVAAGLGGAATLVTVDVARAALELAERSVQDNGVAAPHQTVCMDVPEYLRNAQQAGERFDVIVADPPNFAPNEGSVRAALRSYRALHRAALSLLERGGLYLAASCSSHVRADAFETTLREGAQDIPLQLLERSGAPFDHPRLVSFPEGDYLKVVLTRRCD